MLDQPPFELDLATLTHSELLEVAEKQRATLEADRRDRPPLHFAPGTVDTRPGPAAPIYTSTLEPVFLEHPLQWHWETDADHRFIQMRVRSGRVDPASMGHTRWELLDVDPEGDTHWGEHRDVLEARQAFDDFRYTFVSRNGTEVSVEINGQPVFGEEGEFAGYRGTGFVTDRVVAEQQISSQKERFERILQNMPVMLNAFDDNWTCVMWNRECERVTGYSSEEMVGRRALDVVVPDTIYRERMIQEWDETGDRRDWVWLLTTKSGEERSISWSNISQSSPIADWSAWGVGVDVTDRISAQEEVRAQGDRLRAVFDSLHEGLVIADDEGNILDVNPVTLDMFGYDREELIGGNLTMIMTTDDARNHDSHLATYSITGEKNIIGTGRRLQGRNKEGGAFPIHLHVAEFDRGGRRYYVGSTQDLTEREYLEARQRQSDKLVAIGRLAAGIAHDFNNLLLPIITLTEIMLDDPTMGVQQSERHNTVLAAAERGKEIVQKFLAFSREGQVRTEAVDLPTMVEEVAGLVQASLPEGVSIRTAVGPNVPKLAGNSGEFHELLVNLVVNAVDAIEDASGDIRIELDHVTSGDVQVPDAPAGKSYVRLRVSDNGVGIDKDVMDRLFDPFFTTKEIGVGSGLGLFVVHGIIERMQGSIEVHSEPGEGTTMHVYLPMTTAH